MRATFRNPAGCGTRRGFIRRLVFPCVLALVLTGLFIIGPPGGASEGGAESAATPARVVLAVMVVSGAAWAWIRRRR